MQHIISASFSVEADSVQEAEAKFEEWLEGATAYERYDTPSVAFDCIESVMEADDVYEVLEAPEAQLREEAGYGHGV